MTQIENKNDKGKNRKVVFNMNQFLITLFFVLLTIKLTGAAPITWVVTCIPLYVLGSLFALSVLLTIMVVFAKRIKNGKK